MNRLSGVLLSVAAGACAAPALARGPDVTRELKATHIDRVYMHGLVNGGGSGFYTRGDAMNCYSNVDLSPGASWVFYSPGVHTAGEPIFLAKGGSSSFGIDVGPVAAPAKINAIEFWVYAYDGGPGSQPIPFTVTYEMFDTTVDWSPISTTSNPNTCMPSGDDRVNQVSLGGFFISLSAFNNHANGYTVDIAAAGLTWTVTDGNCFIDNRCWEYSGTSPPTRLSATVYNCFNGRNDMCTYPVPTHYPALGFSFDNFYYDADNDGKYVRNERYFCGGWPNLANLMFRLQVDDGCTMDLNGDGFVNGDDIGYAQFAFSLGCPY